MGWWVKDRGSVCGKNRKFLPLLVSRPVLAPPASCLWYGWGLLSLPPSVANIRHVWSCSSTTSFAFMVWWLIREGNGILWFLHELWNISQRNWEYCMTMQHTLLYHIAMFTLYSFSLVFLYWYIAFACLALTYFMFRWPCKNGNWEYL